MKKVSFTNKNTIYTIPTTNDPSLWWKSHDFEKSYKDMKEELNTLMKIHPMMTIKEAKYMLYQKQSITYEPRLFFSPSI